MQLQQNKPGRITLLIKSFLLVVILMLTASAHSQDLFRGNDLSNINIDNVTDAEIAKFQSQLQANGITMAQAEQIALSKRMPQTEIYKLRERLSRLQGTNNNANTVQDRGDTGITRERQVAKNDYRTREKETLPNIFGSSFFNTVSLSFEPNLRIATPVNYILGPDDEIVINVSGYQEANIRVKVQPEGNINIPQVGQVSVSGLTVEDATKKIRDRMAATAYPNIKAGLTKVNISLGAIRSIHITVIGAAKPGNYTVSSFTTAFNSLYQSGGPGDINSFRQIELRRNNKVLYKIDLYQFLTKGDQTGNVVLQEGDVINFPVYKKRVTVKGEVKRPGIFELLDGETFNDLMFYAGGFSDKAYTAAINIRQVAETERRIKDIKKNEYNTYIPSNGDEVEVGVILDKFQNGVKIAGSVYRPGIYELSQGLTVSGLIKKAEGLKEEAFSERGIINRINDNQGKESISFQVKNILSGKDPDIPLKRGDSIYIAPVTNFLNDYTVTVQGEVRQPGEYTFRQGQTLKDLLYMSGGFTDIASLYRIEISRRINKDGENIVLDSLAEIVEITGSKDLSTQGQDFALRPFDYVIVRKKPGYIEQQRVTITGEILYPGSYTISSKKETISSLLQRAGGLTQSAYADGVFLVRDNKKDERAQSDKLESAQLIKNTIKDTSNKVLDDITKVNIKIAVNMNQVLQHPGSVDDYVLEEGDSLIVPRRDPLVKINGEVFLSTKTGFVENESMNYYLGKAGGVTENARKRKIFVLYSNGQVGKTHNYLFGLIRSYPVVRQGSEIIVPKKPEKKGLTTAETIGLTSTLISLISLIIVTISSLNR